MKSALALLACFAAIAFGLAYAVNDILSAVRNLSF